MTSNMAIRPAPGPAKTTMTNSSQPPRLLTITPELRNKIYRLALTTEDINIDASTFNIRKALVDTSSQLRAETREIFYAENKFTIVLDGTNSNFAVEWLRTLGGNAALVRSLHIKVDVGNAWIKKILSDHYEKYRIWTTNLNDVWVQKVAAQQTASCEDGVAVRGALRAAFNMGLPRDAVTHASRPVYRRRDRRTAMMSEYASRLYDQFRWGF